MAQQSKTTKNAAASTTTNLQAQAKAATFHDFLGMRPADSSPPLFPSKLADPRFGETSPSASVSAGRGPFSSASDLGSGQRQFQNHLEGIPFYPQRSDVTGTQISNRIMGSKRSNANAGLLGHDSIDSLHMMKMFRNGGQSERPWKSSEDELLVGMQPMKQSSGSLVLHPSATGRTDSVLTKWERSIPMNAGSRMPHSSHGGHLGSFVHQVTPNKFESNAGLSIFTQAAADEGSRTGTKGPGVLSSINASASQPEQNSTGLLQGWGSLKAGSHILDVESANPPSRRMTSVARQMTIFYAGQAHVFDEVHPNKADVIMALAGSNGGSWSTTNTSKSASQTINKTIAPSSGLHSAANMAYSREILARASATAHGTGSADRVSAPTGVVMKDARKLIQSVEPAGVTEKH